MRPILLKSAFRFFLTSVFIITWRQVNKVESICVQGLTCVLFIDNIEFLYSSNTANLKIYFLLIWVIECLITGLKLKMADLWLQSLMQPIDFKSYSATSCLMIVSVCTNTCYYYIFFLYYKNSLKCEIHTCLQVSCNQGWGNIAEDPFPFL